ncbi:carbon-nitrogen hydrolase family protein, partial [Planctomycetota bacterium]
ERLDLVDREGLYISLLRDCAQENNIDIAAGSVIEEREGNIYNTSYYVDRSGEILSRYSKVHLWITERPFVTPGNRVEPFQTAYGTAGLSICWDLAFPEVYRAYAAQGAEIVFNVSFWGYEDAGEQGLSLNPDAECLFVDSCCIARAFENELILVYCNTADEWTIGGAVAHSVGRSQICVPFKGPVAHLDHTGEEMVIQEVDTAILKTAEENYRIREDISGH